MSLPRLGVNVTSYTSTPPISPAPAEQTVYYELHVSFRPPTTTTRSGTPTLSYKVYHRYSTLYNFHASLLLKNLPPPLLTSLAAAFPPKDYLSDAGDAIFLTTRKFQLEEYFHLLIDFLNSASDVQSEAADALVVGEERWENVFEYDEAMDECGGLFELLEVKGKKFRNDAPDVEVWHYFVDGGREEVRGMYSHLESREEQRLEAVPLHTGDTMGFKTGVVAGTFAVLCTVAYRLGKMEKEWERVVMMCCYLALQPIVLMHVYNNRKRSD